MRTRIAAVAVGVAGILGMGCGEPPPLRAPASGRGGWPAVVSGDGEVTLSAVAFVPGGVAVAGQAQRGARVAGQEVAAVEGPFVVVLDDVGMPRWALAIEARGGADIEAIALAPGPALVFSGWLDGQLAHGDVRVESRGVDCLVGRIGMDGTVAWLRAIGGPGEERCRRLDVDEDGRVWVVGSYDAAFGDLPSPRGMNDVMVLGLDPATGEVRSALGFGGGGDDAGRDVAVSDPGTIVVAGVFGGTFDATGREVVMSGAAAIELSEDLRLVAAGDYDGFVVQLDREGHARWATAVSGPGADIVEQVIVDGDGYVVVGAQQRGAPEPGTPGRASEVPMDGFVTRLDAEGAARWSFGDPLLASVDGAAVVRGRVAVVARHRHGFDVGQGPWPVAGETGVALALFDATGKLVGGHGCDGPGADRGRAIAATADGRIAFAGNGSADSRCTLGAGPNPAGFVRLMVVDAQDALRPLEVR